MSLLELIFSLTTFIYFLISVLSEFNKILLMIVPFMVYFKICTGDKSIANQGQ